VLPDDPDLAGEGVLELLQRGLDARAEGHWKSEKRTTVSFASAGPRAGSSVRSFTSRRRPAAARRGRPRRRLLRGGLGRAGEVDRRGGAALGDPRVQLAAACRSDERMRLRELLVTSVLNASNGCAPASLRRSRRRKASRGPDRLHELLVALRSGPCTCGPDRLAHLGDVEPASFAAFSMAASSSAGAAKSASCIARTSRRHLCARASSAARARGFFLGPGSCLGTRVI